MVKHLLTSYASMETRMIQLRWNWAIKNKNLPTKSFCSWLKQINYIHCDDEKMYITFIYNTILSQYLLQIAGYGSKGVIYEVVVKLNWIFLRKITI